MNYIWGIKAKPKKNLIRFVNNRLLSFSLILGMGFILMVSLFLNTLIDLLSDRLHAYFNNSLIYFTYCVNIVIVLGITSLLFAIIFKVLPDIVIRWKDAFVGAFVTSILFLLGKFAIGFYIGHASVNLTYGAASAVVVILLWVYYASVILYIGAEFTKVYTYTMGHGAKPNETAVFIVKEKPEELPKGSAPPPIIQETKA